MLPGLVRQGRMIAGFRINLSYARRMPLTSGQLDEIATGVRRLVARNPGFMTGPGTNTYLVGRQHCAVIDPGPHDLVHIERIVAAAGGRVTAILATHTHPDHSPAVATLAHFTGANVLGRAAPEHGRQDATFTPTHVLDDGDVVPIGDLDAARDSYARPRVESPVLSCSKAPACCSRAITSCKARRS